MGFCCSSRFEQSTSFLFQEQHSKATNMPVEKTREEFIVWIRLAMNDRESGAYEQLYQFLWNCFCRADVNNKGKVTFEQFDTLIEEAAELPRLYGFAPSSNAMYSSEALRKAARKKLFNELDEKKAGYVTVSQWIRYAIQHIGAKYVQLPKDYLSGSATGVSKEEFIAFVKRAIDPKNKEYEELYYFLLRTFQAGDKNGYGEVEPAEFDEMIECAAAAPRRFGLAPKTSEMFKTPQARMVNRMTLFSQMDTQGLGKITFDGWLNYALEHI